MLKKIKLRHMLYFIAAAYLGNLIHGYFASIGVDAFDSLSLSAFMTLLCMGLAWTVMPSRHSQDKNTIRS
tara:strand:- start:625 stop:834 length:210 start_codon:yes stop_codon:yes gene_type:complete